MKEECLALAGGAGAGAASSPPVLEVYFQRPGMVNELVPLPLHPDSTLTVAEAYAGLSGAPGMPAEVAYERLPIADETAPPDEILTRLVELLQGVPADGTTAVCFNCQMGRGRTTTGMVCATIMLKAAARWEPPQSAPAALPPRATRRATSSRASSAACSTSASCWTTPSTLSAADAPPSPGRPSSPERRASIKRMSRSAGLRAKLLADAAIEDCAEAQHLVTAIAKCKEDAAKASPDAARSPAFWLARGAHYLERYAFLICFSAYTMAEAPRGYRQSFTAWLRKNWQLTRVIRSLTLE